MAETESETFQEMLAQLFAEMAKEPLLEKIRQKAWDHFLELGLPTRKSEPFRYLRLRNLYARTFATASETQVSAEALEAYVYPECRNSFLVFVNGLFKPHLSRTEALPSKVALLSLSDAARTYSAFIQNQWARSLKEECDPFAALNAALHPSGAFIYLPPKTVVAAPVQILNVVVSDQPRLLMPRLHVFVGKESQGDFYSTQVLLSAPECVVNQVVDFAIEEEAHVRFIQTAQLVQENVWHLEAVRAHLKRNSTLNTICMTEGSATVRNDYHVMLMGENSEASLKGIWMLSDKREAHTHVLMDHQAPNCRSLQLFKGALTDFSRSSFEGKILVRQLAQKTQAFQSNHNLLLSDRAHADSKPNLEIFADDVKASHGATVGQLDKEQLFYLKSRGFSEPQAKELLVYGFCKEVLDAIPLASLLQLLSQRAQTYLTRS